MYTASAVAEKAHCKQAAVRYFARKNSIPKIIVGNKAVFIFDKKDYRASAKNLVGFLADARRVFHKSLYIGNL